MSDLIEDFVDATRNLKSPEAFRRWCGVAMIGAALGRKVHTSILEGLPLYPNVFVVLVSPPGIGKSLPMEEARKMLVSLHGITFSPDEITPQRMIQSLGEIFAPGMNMDGSRDKTYLALLSELGTFMPKPDTQFIQSMARIWDCPATYTRETKHVGNDYLEYPYVCMIAGAQPAWFAEGFPPNAYEMGLPARLCLVYADDQPAVKNFSKTKRVSMETVKRKLKMVSRMMGEMPFTPDAQARWNEWADPETLPSTWAPPVDDPMLRGYGVRRNMHAGKLAMIVAAARHPMKHEIQAADVERALEMLFEIEAVMPSAVSGAGGNIYRLREEGIVSFIAGRYAENKKPVPEWQVRRTLQRLIPPHLMNSILENLEGSKQITAMGKLPNRLFKPGKD